MADDPVILRDDDGEPIGVAIPAAMIEREVIFIGTPAIFESTVLLYDSRLRMRHVAGLKVSRYCFDVLYSAIEPIWPSPWPPPKPGTPRQLVANSGQRCTISIDPPNWPFPVKLPDAGITAQLLPGERSHLVLWCEPGAWHAVEPIWLDLLAELQRLGLIEDGQDKPPAERRSVPDPPPEREDPEYIRKRRQCVKEHHLKGESQKDILRGLRQAAYSVRSRSTVSRDLDWLEEHGEIPPRPKRKKVQQ